MTRSPADQDYQRRALDYVRHVLKETGLTSTALAKRAGVTPSTLNRPLRDPDQSKGLTVRTIGRIANATGIGPEAFIGAIGRARIASHAVTPEISTAVKSARKLRGLTQQELARRIGCAQSDIVRIENGHCEQSGWVSPLMKALGLAGETTSAEAYRDLLAFLHLLRAEHRIDVPERHFETLRALVNTPSVNTPDPSSCSTKRTGAKA